jgi:hypothetical protein
MVEDRRNLLMEINILDSTNMENLTVMESISG